MNITLTEEADMAFVSAEHGIEDLAEMAGNASERDRRQIGLHLHALERALRIAVQRVRDSEAELEDAA